MEDIAKNSQSALARAFAATAKPKNGGDAKKAAPEKKRKAASPSGSSKDTKKAKGGKN
jgi:hypothetical protein